MKKTPKVLILVGCPCSGKSTFAEYYLKFNEAVRFNRDEMRMMLQFSEHLETDGEALLTRLMERMIETALLKGKNVLIDNTHTRKEYIMQIVAKFNYLADIEFKVLDVPLEELLRRNAERSRKVPVGVIKEMYKGLQHLKETFDFQPLMRTGLATETSKLPQNEALPKAIICDLDGTLAITNRNMYRPTEDEIFADQVNEAVATALKGFAGNAKIIFLSGREDIYYNISKKWLEEKAQLADFELFMRKENDIRKDNIIKEEILIIQILPHYFVQGVFDDRMQVCRMWYEKGIFCFNVNQGLVEF
jgi:predicted kinase